MGGPQSTKPQTGTCSASDISSLNLLALTRHLMRLLLRCTEESLLLPREQLTGAPTLCSAHLCTSSSPSFSVYVGLA